MPTDRVVVLSPAAQRVSQGALPESPADVFKPVPFKPKILKLRCGVVASHQVSCCLCRIRSLHHSWISFARNHKAVHVAVS